MSNTRDVANAATAAKTSSKVAKKAAEGLLLAPDKAAGAKLLKELVDAAKATKGKALEAFAASIEAAASEELGVGQARNNVDQAHNDAAEARKRAINGQAFFDQKWP